jgi:hypothetical protein
MRAYFPDSEAVNAVLRGLIALIPAKRRVARQQKAQKPPMLEPQMYTRITHILRFCCPYLHRHRHVGKKYGGKRTVFCPGAWGVRLLEPSQRHAAIGPSASTLSHSRSNGTGLSPVGKPRG